MDGLGAIAWWPEKSLGTPPLVDVQGQTSTPRRTSSPMAESSLFPTPRQTDIHGHTDHTQTHTSDAQLVTPTTALPQPRGVSPALRLQGQGHPDCCFHPTVFTSGWWARANVSLARQQEEGSLTPRRWGLPQEALPCLAEPQLTGRDSRTPESWSSAKREGQCLAPGKAALLGGGALVVR